MVTGRYRRSSFKRRRIGNRREAVTDYDEAVMLFSFSYFLAAASSDGISIVRAFINSALWRGGMYT